MRGGGCPGPRAGRQHSRPADADRRSDAERLLQDFLRRFETKDGALASAAQRFAQLPAPQLVAPCVRSARERGQPWVPLEWLLALSRLRAGDLAGFEASTIAMAGSREAAGAQQANVLEWMRALVDVVRLGGAGAEARLLGVLRGQALAVGIYRDTLATLERAERWSALEAIAAAAQETYPNARDIAAKRELAARNNAAQQARQAEAAEKAARNTVAGAPARAPAAGGGEGTSGSVPRTISPAPLPVGDAGELWRELDADVQRADWAAAARLIGEVRRAAPEWLYEAAAELDRREARVALERADLRRVQQLMRQRLEERKLDVGRTLQFVDLYAARGDFTAARGLAEEIMARVPGSRLAREKLAEIKAAGAADKPAAPR